MEVGIFVNANVGVAFLSPCFGWFQSILFLKKNKFLRIDQLLDGLLCWISVDGENFLFIYLLMSMFKF